MIGQSQTKKDANVSKHMNICSISALIKETKVNNELHFFRHSDWQRLTRIIPKI